MSIVAQSAFWFAVAALIVASIAPVLVAIYEHRVAAQLREHSDAVELKTAESLHAIHLLVNSNLLQAQQRELDASRISLHAMGEVVAMKEASGVEVLQETLEGVIALEEQISSLGLEVALKRRTAG
jgi:hypothetical protein